jgi:hypothetical protein
METFVEEAARWLAKVPREDAPAATEAARNEAANLSKRADALSAKDPRGTGPAEALPVWIEALDLDPSCRGAYEGVAKAVIARAEGDRPTIEAAVRFLASGLKRLPQDAALRELDKKLHSFLPAPLAEPALAVKTHSASDLRPMAGLGAGRVCRFCNSPIPIGAAECRSCQMSGEIPTHRIQEEAPRARVAPGVLIVAVLVVLAGTAAVLWLVFGHPSAS